jgi:transcriptional regulator of heat shock response
MPKKSISDPETNLTARQKNLLFAVIKEYCDNNESIGSKELKEKYGFNFSSATIRNELVELRDLGYLFQPYTNSSSKPTEKAFKLFVGQLILGLQVTSRQQKELQIQLQEMEKKEAKLSKEISRLLAVTTGGVGFVVNKDAENITGIGNLLNAPSEGKVSEILNFLDNLDSYKGFLLEGGASSGQENQTANIKTVFGGENPILPLGKGYAMVATEVYMEDGQKSVVGLVTPVHFLAKEKNLELLNALNKMLGKPEAGNSIS